MVKSIKIFRNALLPTRFWRTKLALQCSGNFVGWPKSSLQKCIFDNFLCMSPFSDMAKHGIFMLLVVILTAKRLCLIVAVKSLSTYYISRRLIKLPNTLNFFGMFVLPVFIDTVVQNRPTLMARQCRPGFSCVQFVCVFVGFFNGCLSVICR